MITRYFCTLFDRNYLLKGLVMIRSLARHCPNLRMYVLCMDDESKTILDGLNIPYVNCLTLSEVETEELLIAKAERGTAEYCWTLSSCFTWFVMNNNPEIDLLTYVDADLMFFSDVQPLFEEIGDASIAIIEHRFSPMLKEMEINGRFCVEWDSFRRDDQGLSCLKRWREQCIDWCFYRLEDGKMGDQKYLDEWPDLYPSCHIIMHGGAGIAPWNYSQYSFRQDKQGNISVDRVPLIFYHFHQFQILEDGRFDRLSSFYTDECPEPRPVYEAYEAELKKTLVEVRHLDPHFNGGLRASSSIYLRRVAQSFLPVQLKNFLRKIYRM